MQLFPLLPRITEAAASGIAVMVANGNWLFRHNGFSDF
jgi:hypothetical protein